jgi:phosphoglycerol transferase
MRPPDVRPVLRTLAAYGGAALLCLGLLAFVMKLWNAGLSVPFEYHDDTLFTLAAVKGTIDNGWYLQNPLLGAPYGQDLHDFPVAESLHFGILKALALFRPDAIAVSQLYFLLTFPLAAVSALFVLRRFGVNYPAGLTASLLYSLLPYHFLHGENHLFLCAYYVVPPLVLVTLWLYADQFVAAPRQRLAAALAVCVLAGCAGVYYAFFGCFFLVVAGVAGAVLHRKPRLFGKTCLLVGVTSATVVLNILPCLLYRAAEGPNSMVPRRIPIEPEIHGLKLVPLLLPVTGHRFPPFREFKATYNDWVPEGENDFVSSGLVCGSGLVLLLAWVFMPRRPAGRWLLLDGLSLLTVCGLLLAIIGGVGGVFFLVVSPLIRAYGRVSIFLAFFALLALALLAEWFYRRYVTTPWRRAGFAAFFAAVLGAGVLDQTSKTFVPPYDLLREEVGSDRAFVHAIEDRVPAGSMIFQLPFVEAPETPGVGRVSTYDHYRGYIHSRGLRWSHGAMIGREASYRLEALARLPLEDMAEALALAGYAGVWVDRRGYADGGAVVEAGLACETGQPPLVSDNGRLSFFPLGGYAERLQRRDSPEGSQARREELLEPLLFGWQDDFYAGEADATHSWRWCGPHGRLLVFNTSERPRRVALSLSVAAVGLPSRRPPLLSIRSPCFWDRMELSVAPLAVTHDVVVPPGKTVVEFDCDGPVCHRDHQRRVFQVSNFSAKEERSPPAPAHAAENKQNPREPIQCESCSRRKISDYTGDAVGSHGRARSLRRRPPRARAAFARRRETAAAQWPAVSWILEKARGDGEDRAGCGNPRPARPPPGRAWNTGVGHGFFSQRRPLRPRGAGVGGAESRRPGVAPPRAGPLPRRPARPGGPRRGPGVARRLPGQAGRGRHGPDAGVHLRYDALPGIGISL